MPVNIDELKVLVRENITEDESGRFFNLQSSDLVNGSNLDVLFTSFLENSQLVIRDIADRIQETPESLTIFGEGRNAIFEGMGIKARFYIVGGQPALLLTAVPGPDWTLLSSFPRLPRKFYESLKFEDPSLYLASHDEDEAEFIKHGLSFSGRLLIPSSDLGDVAWLLGDRPGILLEGAIEKVENGPVISLHAPNSGTVEVGFLELSSITPGLITSYEPLEDNGGARMVGGLEFQAELRFPGGAGGFLIPLRMVYDGLSHHVSFISNLTEARNAGLDELANFLNGMPLADYLPEELPLSDQFELLDLVLEVNLAAKQLEKIKLGVKNAQSWQIWDDVITVEELRLEFIVNDPTDNANLMVTLHGDIGIETGA
jgi:hypothetical protein